MSWEDRFRQQGSRTEDAIKKYPSDQRQIQQIEREKIVQQERDNRVRQQNQHPPGDDRCRP